ncbi:SufD family Fe-S cluster assembly protein, partial [Burkholderia sp. SIMBA_013]
DVDIEHAGEHAFAKFNNVYLLAPRQHFDLHSTIEHASPNGTTEENARGIIGDRAKAVFNGRIHIHRHAQKTLAELNNR